MGSWVASLALLGYCLFIRRYLRWPIEATLFFIISLVIILLYGFAYLDQLSLGAVLLLILGLLMILSAPFYLPKQREILWQEYLTPGFVFCISSIIIFGLIAKYIGITVSGDDIGRWLPHAKWIYVHRGFLTAKDFTINPDYPPGSALFYYFFLQLSHFSESNLFFYQVFLLLAPLAILLQNFRWSDFPFAILAYAGLIILLNHQFHVPLGVIVNALMDSVTGLFFGGILASYVLLVNQRISHWYIIFPLMAMILLRPMVYSFVILSTSIIFCDQFFIKKPKFSIWQKFLIVVLPAMILFSWQHYIKISNLSNTWSLQNLFAAIYYHQSYLNHEQFQQTLSLYFHLSRDSATFAGIMLLLVAVICLLTSDRVMRYRIGAAHFILFLGFFAYLNIAFLFYIYQMDQQLATNLNSFQRFRYTYMVGWALIVIAHFTYLYSRNILNKLHKNPLIFIYGVVIYCVVTWGVALSKEYRRYHHNYVAKKGWSYIMPASNKIANNVQKIVGANAKIALVGDNKFNLISLFSYQLIPNPISTFEIANLEPSDLFVKQIQSFDYLLVIDAGRIFWNKYENYFGNNTKKLASLNYCINTGFNPYVPWTCRSKQADIFLFKIKNVNDKIQLTNMVV